MQKREKNKKQSKHFSKKNSSKSSENISNNISKNISITSEVSKTESIPHSPFSHAKKMWMGILGLLLIITIGLVVVQLNAKAPKNIAATVNGEDITTKEMQTVYMTLPTEYKSSSNIQELVLNQTIYEKIILQEAKKREISATEIEVDSVLSKVRNDQNITLEQINEELQKTGIDLAFLREFYRRQLVIAKTLQNISETIPVSDEEVNTFYKEYESQGGNITAQNVRNQMRLFILQQKVGIYVKDLLAKAQIKRY